MNDEQLFQYARAAQACERDKVLEQFANDDQQVDRVRRLLIAAIAGDSLLDTTAMQSLEETMHEPSSPRSIGNFEILSELGRGGMGVVYEARQKSLKRKVALKVLSSGLGLSSKAILRFRREAEAAGKLHHTNIVPIYTTGEDKGIHFYAMELIEGPSLDQVIKERQRFESASNESLAETASRFSQFGSASPADGRIACHPSGEPSENADSPAFPGRIARQRGEDPSSATPSSDASASISTTSGTTYFDEVATMIADVAEALDHAHEHGVIHRDVKPSNLLLGPDGRLSINDFGLARMLEQPGMTVSGEFVGSPLYMSPEQITAGRVQLDHRTDIYSLGATLYELLTHQPPFPGQTRDQVLSQILHKEPFSTRKLNRRIPVDLDTICMKAIDKDPDRRYQTAGKLADDLRKYVNRHAISARRIGWLGKASKFARRNPAAVSLGFAALLLLGSILVLLRKNRIDALIRTQADTYELIVSGELERADLKCKEARSLGADTAWVERMLGHIAIYEERLTEATKHFNKAADAGDDGVPLKSLEALLQLYSGEELAYFRSMDELLKLEREFDLEDKLYVGQALGWNYPELACEYLDEVREENRTSVAVKYARGYASTWLAQDTIENDAALERIGIAISDLSSANSAWENNEYVISSLLVAHLTAANIYARMGDSEQQSRHLGDANQAAERIDPSSTNAEAIFAKYFLLEYLEQYSAAEKFLKLALSSSRRPGQNYLGAVALVAAFRNKNLDDAHFAYGQIKEISGAFSTSTIDNTKLAFKVIADLSTPLDQEKIVSLRNKFKGYLKKKQESMEYSGFEEDWLALHLLGADPQLASQHAAEATGFFRDFQSPMQSNLVPICQFLASSEPNPTALEETCRKTGSRRTLATAYFGIGIHYLASGKRTEAREYFQKCCDQHVFYFYVHQWSKVMIERLEQRDGWPYEIE